jgi:hypothetical protein
MLGLVVGVTWWASGKVESNFVPGNEKEHRDYDLLQRDSKVASSKSEDEQTTSNRQTVGDYPGEDDFTHPPSKKNRSIFSDKHLGDCPIGATINGRTTLVETARKCRVNVKQIKELLNLPMNVASSERLGRLKRRHGLSIHDVRRLACR